MKVTTNELGNRQVELTIEVESERVEQALRAAARRYARQIKVPGFRPGRAPYPLIARRVGEQRLLQEALEELAPKVYQEAIETTGLSPYKLEPLELVTEDPLTLRAVVQLTPTVELGDYHHIRVEPVETAVSEEEVEAVLREIQEEHATLTPVERPAQAEDVLTADVHIEVEGTTLYERKGVTFVLSPDGFTGVPPGFVSAIEGMEVGEERTFTLTYPADFEDPELAGKEATITVRLHQVRERELPPLDDELARKAGDFESLEQLRTRTREMLQSRAEVRAREQLTEAVLEQVTALAKVAYPPAAVEEEVDRIIQDLERHLADRGQTLQSYLEAQGKSLEELRAEQRPTAEERVKRALVLREVIEREGIEVSAEEIDAEIDAMAAVYGANADEARRQLSTEASRRSIRSRLLTRKAIDRLIEIATQPEEAPAAEASAEGTDVETTTTQEEKEVVAEAS